MFLTTGGVFGSVPLRHLTLDKAAGTTSCAMKVIYYFFCNPVKASVEATVYRALHSIGLNTLECIIMISSWWRFSQCYSKIRKVLLGVGGGGPGLSTVPQCLQGRCHPDSPTGLRLQLVTGDLCCVSLELSFLLPINHLSFSSSELPLLRKNSCEMKR